MAQKKTNQPGKLTKISQGVLDITQVVIDNLPPSQVAQNSSESPYVLFKINTEGKFEFVSAGPRRSIEASLKDSDKEKELKWRNKFKFVASTVGDQVSKVVQSAVKEAKKIPNGN